MRAIIALIIAVIGGGFLIQNRSVELGNQLNLKEEELELNTCYRIDGTPFTTTSDCGNFTLTPKPTSKPTPSPVVNKQVNTGNSNDPNRPVHCNVHANCGGGTTPLTQAECKQSICCETETGKWIFYKDREQCSRNQGDKNTNQNLSPCQLSYGTFNLTPKECLNLIESDMKYANQAMKNTVNDMQNYQPVNYQDSKASVYVNNAELRDECRGNIQSIYQSESTRIRSSARASGVNPSRQLDKLKANLERDVKDCEIRYPVN